MLITGKIARAAQVEGKEAAKGSAAPLQWKTAIFFLLVSFLLIPMKAADKR
ncbi:hypothetical protein [Ktedonosporobacter rubrisoli]|uniref:hypothetical protein n=1 Tax=Ktedonosporobacter rubrisoli TaxID=2509675 RepID=UPI0013EE710D|nr:hypothetical protein [Ktedonosporobacter rubrisoli]